MIYLPAPPSPPPPPHLFMLPIGEKGGGLGVVVFPLYFLPALLIDRPSLKPISHNRMYTNVGIYGVMFRC